MCYPAPTPNADPNLITTISGVKRRTDKSIVEDALKAARAIGKLKEGEPFHLREEADGGVSIVRGLMPLDTGARFS